MLKLRWPVLACLAVAVVGVGAAGNSLLSSRGASPHKAVVVASERLVSAREGPRSNYTEVHGDAVVGAGDGLKTDDQGTAVLTYYDGSTVALAPLTDLVVEQLDGTDSRSLYLNVGRIAISVNKLTSPGSRYEVRTPSATIGVRGTRFVITVTPDGRTEVDVSEGRVALNAAGETLELSAGEGGVVERPGARPLRKGLAVSSTPASPTPQPAQTTVAARIAFRLDRPTVTYGEVFRYCIEGTATVTELVRLGFIAPDGTFQDRGPFGAQSLSTSSDICHEAAFDPRSGFTPGEYTFRWRVNGQPVEFGVILTASSSPTPSATVALSAAPLVMPSPTVPPSSCAPNAYADPPTVRVGEQYLVQFRCFAPLSQIRYGGFTMPDGTFVAGSSQQTLTISSGDPAVFSGPSGSAHWPWGFETSYAGPAGLYLERFITDQGVGYDVKVTLVKN